MKIHALTNGSLLSLTWDHVLQSKNVAVQELVQVTTLSRALDSEVLKDSPFANGFVDDPRKALRRTYEFSLALDGLSEQKIVHRDLHSFNIMIERIQLTREEIDSKIGKVEAKIKSSEDQIEQKQE